MFPILQIQITPQNHTWSITHNYSWGRPKWIPSPGIPGHSPSQQWRCTAVRWAIRGSNLTCKNWWQDMNQLWEAEKIVKSVTNIHDATSPRNYYILLKLQRNYRLLNFFKPTRKQVDSWMGRASVPTWAVQNGWHFNQLLQFALNHSLSGPRAIILAFLLHLFQYFCKRDWDLAGVNVIRLV